PLVKSLSMAMWRWLADDLRLFEARKSHFASLHDCFIRELKPGVRPVDQTADVLISPCDAVVGEMGTVQGLEALQAKGFPYSLTELLGDETEACRYQDGRFITLRLKPSMYHRFHAPCDGRVSHVIYISGDTWNVNPVAVRMIERLYCRNERAVMKFVANTNEEPLALVAVAAILVASVRIHGIDERLHLRYRGPNHIACSLPFRKGEEMGYFEHGSTMVLFATSQYRFVETIRSRNTVRMGQALMRRC
ncbi:MAG: archaetidylserine decarboxylase, partial [Lysobacterales bacterium]